MHKDFHLYGTYLAARIAGFENRDASEIAFAAQAVDDFTYGDYGSSMILNAFADTDKCAAVMQVLWASYHFLPAHIDMTEGDGIDVPERRYITGPYGILYDELQTNLLRDLPASPGAHRNAMMGVVMHVLADTYAHKGFSGVVSPLNVVKDVEFFIGAASKKLGITAGALQHVPIIIAKHNLWRWVERLVGKIGGIFHEKITGEAINRQLCLTKIGHGTAGHLPDISWLEYRYKEHARPTGEYLERCNPQLFLDAFLKMIEVLSQARTGAHADTAVICEQFKTLLFDKQAQNIAHYTQMGNEIFGEEHDDIMAQAITGDAFGLPGLIAPGDLNEQYAGYIDRINVLQEDDFNSLNGDPFGASILWHRSNVLATISGYRGGFPQTL